MFLAAVLTRQVGNPNLSFFDVLLPLLKKTYGGAAALKQDEECFQSDPIMPIALYVLE